MSESLFLQKSAAFWPPWPSKIAKQALADDPLKPSLTMNYRNDCRLAYDVDGGSVAGQVQQWIARANGSVQIFIPLDQTDMVYGYKMLKLRLDETDVKW